jgi:hypothetical protein
MAEPSAKSSPAVEIVVIVLPPLLSFRSNHLLPITASDLVFRCKQHQDMSCAERNWLAEVVGGDRQGHGCG